jgi:hypothetical protein
MQMVDTKRGKMYGDHIGPITEGAKSICDLAGLLIIGGVFVEALPKIAAAMAIIWYCVRFYEWYMTPKKKKPRRRKKKAGSP